MLVFHLSDLLIIITVITQSRVSHMSKYDSYDIEQEITLIFQNQIYLILIFFFNRKCYGHIFYFYMLKLDTI